MKNLRLSTRTIGDINTQVDKILVGLGNPEPPIDLRLVRELLNLDLDYYSSADDSLLRETISRLKVAGIQVLKRPTLVADAVRSLSLKALYLPDPKRILIDKDVPELKHRWIESHEIGHDIIPWHAGMMIGDNKATLTVACHEQMEAEANYAAGQILFLAKRFEVEALDSEPSIDLIKSLKKTFGNTLTTTLWRYVEQVRPDLPMVGLITSHPHLTKRKADFDPQNPCRYCVQSPAFEKQFGHITEIELFAEVQKYCGSQRGGVLGENKVLLLDGRNEGHLFGFKTFFNGYDALTLAVWERLAPIVVAVA